jgi:hypothetical protein
MYVQCILYSYYLYQQMHNIYIYIYIYTHIYMYIYIKYFVRNPTCFDASLSSSGSLILVLAKVTKLSKL